MTARLYRGLLCALLGFGVACGGSSASGRTASGSGAGGSLGRGSSSASGLLGLEGPDKPWADMSYQEREWYMIAKVHPISQELFLNYDDTRYAQFECVPCHGEDGKAKKYKMPSDHLGPLPDPKSEKFADILDSPLGEFMAEQVTPVTARLLGLPTYDAATGQGFGCFACHRKE